MSAHQAPENAAVWFELPVSDLKASANFYGKVLETELAIDTMMGNEMAMFPTKNGGVGGNLYPDAAAAGAGAPVIHLASPPLEGAMDRVAASGGNVASDIVALPSGGRFVYCTDPDGNRFGLFNFG